ncbi:hypothetical protein TNIN_70011 [Trichonephila inaurata madagascariensis]|uniref:Uncharacterized protein n=1 Tax=Trichonephila inaurata madagascariensis TaxID=2747483 RepID=A0A8X6XNW6_9ARAC|nr:hypothetical protein TNIN_70011 [Trichonephila inaurata madagascariensis]
MLSLQNEFTRFSTVHLTPIDQIMINKMNGGDRVLFSLNCQSLRAYARDLRSDNVQKAHILMLSETWLRNEELVEIENVKLITQHRRDFVRKSTQYINQTKSNLGDNVPRDALYLTLNPLLSLQFIFLSIRMLLTLSM